MLIKTVATGSTGNCYIISGYKTKIILECGVKIETILEALDYDTENTYCLVTHEHKDHSLSAQSVILSSIPTYMTKGTADAINVTDICNIVSDGQQFTIGEFTVSVFNTNHDAKEPVGFLIESNIEKKRILFITDSHYMEYVFSDIYLFMVEVNFDYDTLIKNVSLKKTNGYVANRILKSHFSLEKSVEFLKKSDATGKMIMPIHMSKHNLDFNKLKSDISTIGTYIDVRNKNTIKI